jgi:hypothetical protein
MSNLSTIDDPFLIVTYREGKLELLERTIEAIHHQQ